MSYERSAYFLRYFSGSSLVRLGDLNLLEIWYQKIEDKIVATSTVQRRRQQILHNINLAHRGLGRRVTRRDGCIHELYCVR